MKKISNYSLGDVFKRIRENVFRVSLLEMATLIDTSSTSYNRFEKNNFGKNFENKKTVTLMFWAEKISEAVFEESERKCLKLNEIIKTELLTMYKESVNFDEKKLFYLEKYNQNQEKLLIIFIYNIFLIFSGEKNVNISEIDIISGYIKTQDIFRYKNSILGKIVNFKELKNCVIRIVDILNPKDVFEIGFGTGLVATLIEQIFPDISITAIDNRPEMKEVAEKNAGSNTNINFTITDYNYLDKIEKLPQLTIMVYSFHHIEDPIKNKLDFLKKLKSKMCKNSKLCIADIFIPESHTYANEITETRRFWDNRIFETYCNTFWTALDGFDSENLAFAIDTAKKALNSELVAADAVLNRKNEYLIKMSTLLQIAKEAGFKVDVAEYCNSMNDGIVVLS